MKLAVAVIDALRRKGLLLANAESCTGGMVAAAITDIAGSSDVFERGFVTYSNLSKTQMLGVNSGLIETHGAVSAQVAIAMAEGVLQFSKAQISVAITGVAGPGGGSFEKPVGLVHFAVASHGHSTVHSEMRFGDVGRFEVRTRARDFALQFVLDQVNTLP
jgi:nicotinamide-nucleotide amidase